MSMNTERNPEVTAMWERLNAFLTEDQEEGLSARLTRTIRDPLNPLTGSGRLRVNPVLQALAAITLFAVGTFIFFSFGHT